MLLPNLLKLDKNATTNNCSYALLSGVYYNEKGFSSVTNSVHNILQKYDENKYVFGRESKPNKSNYVNYENNSQSSRILSTHSVISIKKIEKDTPVYNNLIVASTTPVKEEVEPIITKIVKENKLIELEKPISISKDNIHKDDINNTKKAVIKDIKDKNIEEVKKETKVLKETKNIIYSSNKNISKKYNPQNNILQLSGWVRFYGNILRSRNFGDDINFSFLPCITGYTHNLYRMSILSEKNFLMIGSILIDKYIDKYTEIWGAGMLRPTVLKKKPNKVYAVRGPKTREIVLKSNVDCPEIYGDPALLIPYYYYPYTFKKYKLGIIPHHTHIYSTLLNKFKNDNEIKIIDFTCYNNWKDVIKLIVQCEFIVSESLHGLIISEAFKIPNIWISFGRIGLDFKYEDFFLSIGKTPYNATQITSKSTKEDLLNLKEQYDNTFNLNLNKLVTACPILLKNLNMNNNIKQYTGKVLLCCIGKMENQYIREFVEYYKNLGFDNICLYDNNDEDGEHFEDVISDYIESGYVILKDWRGKKLALIPSYTDCYNTYKDEYDWITFFDIDEFLHIDNNENIKLFLSKDIYNDRGINCIRICWKLYTDSDIIKTEGDYSVNKFKDYLPLSNMVSSLSKIILKTQLDNVTFNSPHGIWNNKITAVNTAGELCANTILIRNKTWLNAYLAHYRFKTIEEFVLNKMVRLWPTHYLNGGKTGLNLSLFFRYNKKTLEKVEYAEYLLDKYNISRNE